MPGPIPDGMPGMPGQRGPDMPAPAPAPAPVPAPGPMIPEADGDTAGSLPPPAPPRSVFPEQWLWSDEIAGYSFWKT